jgi:hypothetical protein
MAYSGKAKYYHYGKGKYNIFANSEQKLSLYPSGGINNKLMGFEINQIHSAFYPDNAILNKLSSIKFRINPLITMRNNLILLNNKPIYALDMEEQNMLLKHGYREFINSWRGKEFTMSFGKDSNGRIYIVDRFVNLQTFKFMRGIIQFASPMSMDSVTKDYITKHYDSKPKEAIWHILKQGLLSNYDILFKDSVSNSYQHLAGILKNEEMLYRTNIYGERDNGGFYKQFGNHEVVKKSLVPLVYGSSKQDIVIRRCFNKYPKIKQFIDYYKAFKYQKLRIKVFDSSINVVNSYSRTNKYQLLNGGTYILGTRELVPFKMNGTGLMSAKIQSRDAYLADRMIENYQNIVTIFDSFGVHGALYHSLSKSYLSEYSKAYKINGTNLHCLK